MKNTTTISCVIGTTDREIPLGLEVWLDSKQIHATEHVKESTQISHDLDDAEGQHVLRFVMKNKTSEHTQLNSNNQIVKDACLTVNDLTFDGIELNQIFIDNAVYTHNLNGTGSERKDKFYGEMGCNGTVTLLFATPVYLWLLEHM